MSKTIKLLGDDSSTDRIILTTKELLDSVSDSMELFGGKNLSRTVTAFGIGVSLFNVGRTAYNWYKENHESKDFYIKITSDGALFKVAENWLMNILPEGEQRSLFTDTVFTINDGNIKNVSVRNRLDGSIQQEVVVGGHKVIMSTESVDIGNRKGRPAREGTEVVGRMIKFACKTSEARQAVLDELSKRANEGMDTSPDLYRSRAWGEFVGAGKVTTRPIDSVILKEGQMKGITDFLKRFRSNEPEYVKMGIPYHTGILLHGLPGSGKSSTAIAIANELEMDTYFVSLSSLSDDDSLYSCMQEVEPGSIVIFEDIDTAQPSKSRDDGGEDEDSDETERDQSGVTLNGLLNSLDGQMAPHGVVFIMTTNHVNRLDDALTRSGRIDLRVELDAVDDYQLRKMCEYYIGYVPEGLPHVTPSDGITTSDLVTIFKGYMPTYEGSVEAIIEFVNDAIAMNRKPVELKAVV